MLQSLLTLKGKLACAHSKTCTYLAALESASSVYPVALAAIAIVLDANGYIKGRSQCHQNIVLCLYQKNK